MRRGTLTITLNSDWHIGLGAGRQGAEDRLVLKDEDKLPYIPAKTITGLWRDSCEFLAQQLDQAGGGHAWQQAVQDIFGSQPPDWGGTARQLDAAVPTPARISLRPARFAKEFRKMMRVCPELREEVTFRQPGVKIDRATGKAQDDHLFFLEKVRSGAMLTSLVELDDSLGDKHLALLQAGLRNLRRLGGKRRRGAGRCSFAWDLADCLCGNWQALFDKPPDRAVGPREACNDRPSGESVARLEPVDLSQQGWTKIPFLIKARTPLVISAKVAGNVVTSLDYVPGTMLLAHLTKALRQARVASPGDCIGHGLALASNAYPCHQSQPLLPWPAAVSTRKESSDTGPQLFNGFVGEFSATQMQTPKKVYVLPKPGERRALTREPDLAADIHNTVDDATQRPTERVGGIYTYQCMPAGTLLAGEFLIASEVAPGDLSKLKEALFGPKEKGASLRLGRSKKDDYGEALIRPARIQTAIPAVNTPGLLTVWLLSDLLLRDESLAYSGDPELLRLELEKRLGAGLNWKKAAGRAARRDSFHTGWNLPRPSLVGLAAGDCFCFQVSGGTIDPKRLAVLEDSGLGERTAEGFGRISFNHPFLAGKLQDWKLETLRPRDENSIDREARLLARDNQGYDFMRQVELAAWKREVRRKALDLARQEKPLGQNWPRRKSQLGGLRAQFISFQNGEDSNRVEAWLDKLEATSNRQKTWKAPLLAAIRQRLQSPREVWTDLEGAGLRKHLGTADGEEALKNELTAFATQSIFLAICGEALKGGE